MYYCAIHSEPNITEPRIFLSIVFTDEENINNFKDKKYYINILKLTLSLIFFF